MQDMQETPKVFRRLLLSVSSVSFPIVLTSAGAKKIGQFETDIELPAIRSVP